jgi:hypothetical protein
MQFEQIRSIESTERIALLFCIRKINTLYIILKSSLFAGINTKSVVDKEIHRSFLASQRSVA